MEFDVRLSLPRDIRYAVTARLVALHAAREAGSSGASAEAFGAEVEHQARSCLSDRSARQHVVMTVARGHRALAVTVGPKTMTLELES